MPETRTETLGRPGQPEEDHIHTWFGLSYANYLTLPRILLQSMPGEWQARFVRMLNELQDAYPDVRTPPYQVNAVDAETGRFIRDPVPHYERGRAYLPPAIPAETTNA